MSDRPEPMSQYVAAGDDFLAQQRLLVIAPHADDEAFGCAGTIAKIKALGGEVFVMLMSVGDLEQYNSDIAFAESSTRISEFEDVVNYLKIDDYDIVLKDSESYMRLDAMPRRDLIHIIEKTSKLALDRINPTIVALPAISHNQDHVAVFYAGFTACRAHDPSVKSFPNIVLAYDNPTLFWNVDSDKFRPNFYVDISKYLDAKLNSMRLHKSQLRHSPHCLSIENMEYLSRVRGHEISVAAAEAYMCYRLVL
ncbi:MAG: PIG-L deacetylase family protein [Lentisphaeria bacterium]|jgi:LmbE family N-acetylglucosaminyl deacetylase|nr:PIG-L deacetylase family protein [Lentisphaeria bacterium]MDP7741414.1 PIG-L deacetylase family protein [Lentisphaeria bacterium]